MKIAITSVGADLKSEICPRFGRADYFLIIDAESLEYEAVENPNRKAVGGAGIQSSQLMINKDVSAVLSGQVGMNAFRMLDSAEILVYENVEGIVEDAIRKFKSDELKLSNNPRGLGNKNRHGFRGRENSIGKVDNINAMNKEKEILEKRLSELNDELNKLNK